MFPDGVVKFEQTIDVPIHEDSHLIVVAYGEHSDLTTGYGTSSQSKMHPCAYNNPIFIVTGDHDTSNPTAIPSAIRYPCGEDDRRGGPNGSDGSKHFRTEVGPARKWRPTSNAEEPQRCKAATKSKGGN